MKLSMTTTGMSVMIALFVMPMIGWAQQQPSAGQRADSAHVVASQPALPPAVTEDEVTAIFRAPLLREGSSVVNVIGRVTRDSKAQWWVFEVDHRDAAVPGYALALLPCTRLAEMLRIRESTANPRMQFRVTGSITVYQGRNHLLTTHAAVVTESEAPLQPTAPKPPPPQPSSVASSTASTTAANSSQTMADTDESAQDILRDLEQAAGPVVRGSSPPVESSSRERDGHTGLESESQVNGTPTAAVMQEQVSVIDRRGKLTRDAGGGWLFVFDADAAGLADPPLKLLPCLLLEKLEDYARRSGNNSPVLLTGTVFLFNGRNYVLPTVYRIPQERKNLVP